MQWSCNLAHCGTRMSVKNSKSIRPLGRSPKELLDTVDDLKLEERTATTSASGELAVEKHVRMTHEEANWRLSLTQPSGYSNSFSSGNEGLDQALNKKTLNSEPQYGSLRPSVTNNSSMLGMCIIMALHNSEFLPLYVATHKGSDE